MYILLSNKEKNDIRYKGVSYDVGECKNMTFALYDELNIDIHSELSLFTTLYDSYIYYYKHSDSKSDEIGT